MIPRFDHVLVRESLAETCAGLEIYHEPILSRAAAIIAYWYHLFLNH